MLLQPGFAEGKLLVMDERVAEISHTVRAAGELGKCGSAASSTLGLRPGSCLPEHRRSNRGAVFAEP